MLKNYLKTMLGFAVVMFVAYVIILTVGYTSGNVGKAIALTVNLFTHLEGLMTLILPAILVSAVYFIKVFIGMNLKSTIFFVAAVILLLKVLGIFDVIAVTDASGIGGLIVTIVGIAYGFIIFVLH